MRRIDVRPRGEQWVVRIRDGRERVQFTYSSERQARYFAAVYRLQNELLRRQRIMQAAPQGDARPE